MNIKLKNTVLFVFSIIALSSCDKNEIEPLQETIAGSARITVINAVPGSPSLDAFYGDLKLNGNTIAALSRFPSTEYSALPSATYSIKAIVNTPPIIPTTAPNIAYGTVVSTTSAAMAADKYYSLFIVGPPEASSITSFLIEDKLPQPVSGKAHVRFINVMPDGNNMDLLSGTIPDGSVNPTTLTVLFTNVVKNTAKDFIEIEATNVGTPYQFQLRNNLTSAIIVSGNLTVVSGRVYTIYSRGFNTTYTIPVFTPARTVAAGVGFVIMTNK